MNQALIIISFVIAIILIVILYMQSGKVKNIGSSIVGTKDVELFENTKRRGMEKFLYILTIALVFFFFLLPILALIIGG